MRFVVKVKDEWVGDEDLLDVVRILDKSKIDRCNLFFDDKVLYFNRGEYTVAIIDSRRNVGALRFYEKNLIKKIGMKLKLKNIEDVFKLAEEIERMDLDEFISKRGDV